MGKGLPAWVALAAALSLRPALARGQEPQPAPSETGAAAPGQAPAAGDAGAVAAQPAEPAPPVPPVDEPARPSPPSAEPTAPPPPAAEASPATPGQAPESAQAPPKPDLLDASHAAVEERLRDLVDWLDRFFGDRRYLEFGLQRSTVRWRSEVRLTDEPRAYPHTTALVDLRLPAAAAWLSRFHLVLAGDRVAEAEGAPSGEPVTELATDQGRLELRYDLVRRPGTLLYLGGGVRFAWPPDPFTRFRLRQDFPLTTTLLARFSPSVFWALSQGLGATMQLDLDQALSRTAVVRASAGVLASQKSRGLEWGTSLELRAPVASRLVGALGGSVNGVEQSPLPVEQYRVFARLRADVVNHWLFAEVEPEVVWPANPPDGYRTVLGVILRLEVLFVSEIPARPPEPAPAPKPEPPSAAPAPEVPWP